MYPKGQKWGYSGTKDKLTIPLTAWRDRTLLPRKVMGASNKVTCLSLLRERGTKKKICCSSRRGRVLICHFQFVPQLFSI